MAHFVLTDASVVLNAVDLSDHIKTVTLDYSADEADDNAMGDTFNNRIPGLKDWSVSLEAHDDYAAGEVDATLWTIFSGGAAVTITIKPTSAAVGATNPSYSGPVMLSSQSALGSHGDKAMRSVSLTGAGTLARATS